MDHSRILPYTHKHCRFKLRSGKEIYGVVWEVEVENARRLFFASVRDYERLQRDQRQPISVMPLQPEEVISVERLASDQDGPIMLARSSR